MGSVKSSIHDISLNYLNLLCVTTTRFDNSGMLSCPQLFHLTSRHTNQQLRHLYYDITWGLNWHLRTFIQSTKKKKKVL